MKNVKKSILIFAISAIALLVAIVCVAIFGGKPAPADSSANDSPVTSSLSQDDTATEKSNEEEPVSSKDAQTDIVIEDYDVEKFIIGEKTIDNPPKTQTVDIAGKSITAKFSQIQNQPFDDEPGVEYVTDDGYTIELMDDFKVLSLYRAPFDKWHVAGNLTEEQCKAAGEKFADEYLDVSEYTLTDIDDSEENNYLFYYYRFIDGIKTNDFFILSVNTNGDVVSFSRSYIKQFQKEYLDKEALAKAISSLHSPEVLEDLNKKAIVIPNYYNHTINETLLVLSDGSYAMRYSIEIEQKTNASNGDTIYSGEIQNYIVRSR